MIIIISKSEPSQFAESRVRENHTLREGTKRRNSGREVLGPVYYSWTNAEDPLTARTACYILI